MGGKNLTASLLKNQKIKTPIAIKNPYQHDIEILEAYSTVDFVKLYWPNEKRVNSRRRSVEGIAFTRLTFVRVNTQS